MADAPLIDQYSGLSHKVGMSGESGGVNAAPAYLPPADARRINAYARLSALIETVGRLFVAEDPTDPDKLASWREFGEPGVLARQIATSVLGKEPIVAVVGADQSVPDEPDIPEAPRPPVDDPERSPEETRILTTVYQRSLELWRVNAEAELARWLELTGEVPTLQDRQDWLRDWADVEQLIGKVTENEQENIVPLGDGVYVLSWDHRRVRPKVEIYEPDVYVPVLDDAAQTEYPTKVHLVWQFVTLDSAGKEQVMVRRITWELIDVEDPEIVGFDLGPEPRYLPAGEKRTAVCVQSDGTWPLDAFEKVGVNGVPQGGTWRKVIVDGQEVELNQAPTGLDFIPVVHVPHTLSTRTHFGQSPLVRLVQLFDELAAADTDDALSASWAARPPVWASGMALPKPGEPDTMAVRPGVAFRLSEHGRIGTIEMAANLEAIGGRIEKLLKRVSVNAQVPEGILGRVDASQVPSGLALTLSFTSFEQMIDGARLVRAVKYRLLLKMVQRIAIQNDDPKLGGSVEVYPAEIRFGTFMPQDLAGLASLIVQLFTAHLVSLETALVALQESGLPVEDIGREVTAIRSMMADVAEQIASATGLPVLAGRFMGYTDADLEGAPERTVGAPPVAPPGPAFDVPGPDAGV